MPVTAQLGTADSQPGNIEPGLDAVIQPFATTAAPSLVVEVAFGADPVTTAGYYYNVLNDGPAGYWRMDSATTLVDQTGAGNTMTVEGSPTVTTTLVSGDGNASTVFNGTSQDAYAPSNAGLSPTGPLSFELWIKTPGSLPGSTVDLVQKRGSYGLQLNASGHLCFSAKNGITTGLVVSNTTLATSTTYHVACVYDGSKLLLYLNGVLNASSPYGSGFEAVASRLKIAGGDNGTTAPAYTTNTVAGASASAGLTQNRPASTADGDYLLAQLLVAAYTAGPQTVADAPAGWTLLGSTTLNNSTMYVYGKVAAGEPTNWTWTLTGPAMVSGSVTRYTGPSTFVPVGSVATASSELAASQPITFLPAFDNSLVVSLFGSFKGSGSGTWTESVGTERFEYNPSGPVAIAVNTLSMGAAALTTNTGTNTVGNAELHAIAVELVGATSANYAAVTVDEVSVFGLALTAAQVQNHYLQAITPPPTVTWTDISADVRVVQIQRGRQYELNRMEAGTATLTLNDDLRKYDPANDSSPYAPNVIPLRQIRVRALLSGTYYPLFQGYIERWSSRWEVGFVGNHAECDITAVDGFEPLSLTALAGTTQASLSGATIANLLGAANWPAQSRDLDAGAFNLAAITRDARTGILEYIQQVADGEAGFFFIDGSGTAVFHDKNHRSTDPKSTVSQGLFGDQTLLALPYTSLVPSKDKDHIVNDWTVTDRDGVDHHAVASTDVINKSFRRTSSRSTFLTAADAETMASYLLSLTALPGYRFDEMEVIPGTNLPLWLQALQREISDRVTVQRQPVGIVPGSQIVKDCWIERVQWLIVPGMPWRVKWQLSPAT